EVLDSEDEASKEPETAEVDENLIEDILPDETLEAVADQADGSTTSTISEMTAKGWNESIYANVLDIKAADVKEVKYSGTMNGELDEKDLQYLVRDNDSGVRIDVLGLKEGTYSLTVTALSGSTKTVDNITVYAYDRSGYAHFNYEGVGAYNDDGTLKDNAVVLYVTDENKNDIELKVGSKTVKGIGNILNSGAGANKGIIKDLATAGKPLVVRFIGTVSESSLYSKGEWSASYSGLIDGLTVFNSSKNGGSGGDNGHMARIRSGKDITLEGIGTDAVIDGWGFHYVADGSGSDYGKSFEVRNLTFINTPEDAVGMEGQQSGGLISDGVERCWVHNNEFYCPHIIDPAEDDKAEGDGSVDFKRGEYFTCSYNYFEGCHKTNLVGANSTTYQYNLTYHHNYYYKCDSRGPLSRNANIHMYNNVYEQQKDYAMDARASAYIFAEYNLFYAASNPHTTSREGGGTIKSYKDSFSSVLWINGKGNIVDDKGIYVANNCQYSAGGVQYDRFDLDSTLSYIPNGDYDLQTDFMKMRAVLASQLGVQKGNPIPVAEITPDDYSMVLKSGAAIKQIELPFSDAPGEIFQTTYAFNVDVPFNINVKYGLTPGILVNDAGENLLEGDGARINLPAGRYMIQSTDFVPAETGGEIWNACNIDSIKIDEYAQGSGGDLGIVIKPGDYVLNFEGMAEVDPNNFFDVTGDYVDSEGSVIVEGKEYKDGLKMNSNANVTFKCNDGGTLTLIFNSEYSGKTVKVDGEEHNITSDGTIVLKELPSGTHSITTGDIGVILLYVVVSDGEAEYTIVYKPGSASMSGDFESVVAKAGVEITLPKYEAAEGYMFTGWSSDGITPIDGDKYIVNPKDASVDNVITITALYNVTVYDIKYDPNGGTLPAEELPQKGKTGETLTLGDCTPANPTTHSFVGWSVGNSEPVKNYIVKPTDAVNGTITLKAVYEENASHKGIAIVGLKSEYEFTGAKIIPNIAVVDYDIKGDDGKYGKVLRPGVDYTVKYANNSKLTSVSKKDAIVTVKGKGNYAGKDDQATFKIVEPKAAEATLEDLKGAKLSKINPVEYTGKPQYPEIELKLKNGTPIKYTYDEEDGVYEVKEGTDQGTAIGAKVSLSNNINKGTATILITGKVPDGKTKATSVKKTFKITPIDISKENKLSVVADPATYAVKGAVPASITVKYGEITLRKGVDYTVKYSSNKKAGEKAGKITISGKGNYAKKYTSATYDIQQLEWSAEDTGEKNPIKAIQAYAGLKAGKIKATVVDNDGNTLKPAQYTLKVYKNDETEECPKAYVLIEGDVLHVEATAKDTTNLKGTTAKADFTVAKGNIAKAKFVLNKVNGKAFTAQYTGEEIKLKESDLTVTMKGVNGNLHMKNAAGEGDYEIVSYSNNINKGTATAVIKGINGYSGTKTVKFKIVGKTMAIGEKDISWDEITSQFKSFMDVIFN
ncbi:MAG: hypothetical protein HDR29_00140, partial [Lachnospiraceae bacterium]|nr:hypothetical protein [Lachnospiraceae bacterium]